MADEHSPAPIRGLDRIEIILFVFGVLAFGLLILAFGQPLAESVSLLPVVAGWVVVGLLFIWWFDRHLAGGARARANEGKLTRLHDRRRRRRN